MEQNVLISVIVPVYNVEAFLPKCVDSILNQTYRNLEVILVDDGTKDASDEICDRYAEQDSRVKVIHKLNGGLSSARNAGLEMASGEYIAFVDSDDWLEPDAYEAMLSGAIRHGVLLVCAGRYDVSGRTGQRKPGLCPQREEVVTGQELVRRIFHWENLDSAAWDKLYHRSLFREIRYPLGKIVEDVPTTYRIALLAGRALMLPKPIYNYYHRPNSITTAAVSEKTFHFSEHTARICQDIAERCPELTKEARFLRVRSLVHNVQSLDLSSEEVRKQFEDRYADSKRELRSHIGFILSSSLFTQKEKREYPLMALGLYRPMRKLYHLLGKKETV